MTCRHHVTRGSGGGSETTLLQIISPRPLPRAVEMLQQCWVLKHDFPANNRGNPVSSSEEEAPRTGPALHVG